MSLIPEFKNTGQAEAFGRDNRGNGHLIDLMEKERARLRAMYHDLMAWGKEGEALALASGQIQFLREAIQEAQKERG